MFALENHLSHFKPFFWKFLLCHSRVICWKCSEVFFYLWVIQLIALEVMLLLLLLLSNRKHTFLQLNPTGIEITMGEEFHLIIALQLDLGYLFIGPF